MLAWFLTLPEFLNALFCPERRIQYANLIYRKFGEIPLESRLASLLFDFFIENRILPKELESGEWSDGCRFLLDAARDLWSGIAVVARELAKQPKKVFPNALDYFAALPVPEGEADLQRETLSKVILAADRFRQSRMFRYWNGRFFETKFDSIKPPSSFTASSTLVRAKASSA